MNESAIRIQFANADKLLLGEECLMREYSGLDFYVGSDDRDFDAEGRPIALFVDVHSHAAVRVSAKIKVILRRHRILADVSAEE